MLATGQITPEELKVVTDQMKILTDLTGKDYLDLDDAWRNTETEQEELLRQQEAALNAEAAALGGAPDAGGGAGVAPVAIADPGAR